MVKHECWCVAYLRKDGTPTTRFEYFKTEAIAAKYSEGSNRNGANTRYFRMLEV
jgi:hypothetical protein